MYDPVMWNKTEKGIVAKMIGEWNQTIVVAGGWLPGVEHWTDVSWFFVESWEQPMILDENKGWLFCLS